MTPVTAMAVLFGVLILALMAYFAFMWTKEKGRSDEQGSDSARQQAGRKGRGTPGGSSGA